MRSKVFEVVNREISWLSFNHRVLQEAMDESVPLIERVRFLGIFSNNLDEFFRVRVATVKRLEVIGKKSKQILGMSPKELLEEIQKIVLEQQILFEQTYSRLFNELRKHEIYIVNEKGLTKDQLKFVQNYFHEKVRPSLVPIMLDKKMKFPFLEDREIYLAIKLHDKNKEIGERFKYVLIKVPTKNLSRFLVLPSHGKQKYLILLDDIIRANLRDIFSLFNYEYIEAFTIKLTRDAELDIDSDLSKSLVDKISKSLKGRKVGQPVRLVYDSSIPNDLYNFIVKKMEMTQSDNLIPGGRYHNFRDFINFPGIGNNNLKYSKIKPLNHPGFKKGESLIDYIATKDVLVYYPYHNFGYIIDLLREVAIDPSVRKIQITLYRVAKESRIINALTSAVKNGKVVNVIVELQARFDEEANIFWSNKLQEEGVKVIFGVPGLKVHSKLFLITRKEDKKLVNYAHIGTGNFHEGTAKIYTDHALLTSDRRITTEVEKVFDFFSNNYKFYVYKHLMLSPYHTRGRFIRLINKEIRNSKEGKEAYILIKLNNLVDNVLVQKLYQAGRSGVKIRLIIRGICAVIPGVKGISENIEAKSIVDRFLEHSRVMIFCNGGEEKYYISSADWMTRNLDKRIEVTTPIYDIELQKELRDVFEIQWNDNEKARVIDSKGLNKYHLGYNGMSRRSQYEIFSYYQEKTKPSDKLLDLPNAVNR